MPDVPENLEEKTARRSRLKLRSRLFAATVSVGAHLAILVALIAFRPTILPPPAAPSPPVAAIVTFPPPPPPAPAEESPEPAGDAAPVPPAPPTPPPRQAVRQPPPIPPPPDVPPIPAPVAPAPQPLPGLSDAQLAGAMLADSGLGVGAGAGVGGGGAGAGSAACDMVRRLQDALRRDPDIGAAVAREQAAAGPGARGVIVWDGDWIQSGGQEGKGLAGVRQAIALEVAFAPAACRSRPMRGLVVLSLAEGARPARLALGDATWRWSDLLGPGAGTIRR